MAPDLYSLITHGFLLPVERVDDANDDERDMLDVCQVDSASVETFGQLNVSVIMNECYHLLFKDCSGKIISFLLIFAFF